MVEKKKSPQHCNWKLTSSSLLRTNYVIVVVSCSLVWRI